VALIRKENKIAGYRKQLDKIGFSFDWSSENFKSGLLQTYPMDFIQLFNSWYNKDNDKAEDVSTLISIFEKEGNATAVCDDKIAVLRQ
jgi:leucyl-tRNA synthetase